MTQNTKHIGNTKKNETLKDSEARYRRLFETAQDGILILNADTGKVTDVNPFLIDMLGYSYKEFMGKKLWEIGSFKDVKASRTAFEKLQLKEFIRYEDLPLETKDGKRKDVEFVSNVYQVNDKRVIQCNIRDITERKKAEEALKRARNKLKKTTELEKSFTALRADFTARKLAQIALQEKMEGLRHLAAVVSDSNDAVIMHDLEGKILAWNRGAKETYGYSESEALKMNVLDIVAETDRPAALELIQKVIQGAAVKSFELQRVTKDGRTLDIWLTKTLLTDAKGKPVAIATTERDITDRKLAEKALKERVEDLSRLATVISDSNDAVIMHDLEGKILAWNRGAKETYGYTEAEALKMNVRDIVAGPDREAAKSLIERIKKGDIVKSFELRRTTKDGRILDVWLTTTLLTDENGKPVAIATTERDITARKMAEAERSARKAAEVANAAKSEFLSRMSHELRTPMNSILGFAQLLEMSQKEPLTPGQHERVSQILKGGQMLLEIINEVLDISRIEAGRMSISPEPVEIRPVLEEVLDLVSPLAAERRIKINLKNIPSNQFIRADSQRLTQVLLNLIGNAIKYNREDGGVTITSENLGASSLRVNICDTGIGIPSEKILMLFQPFERVSVKEGVIEGTGLGLAVSKRLIELMGGTIGVESIFGEGSTFWFILPLTESPIEVASKDLRKPKPAVSTSRARTILYIEDNLANFELVKQVLSEQPQIELLWAIQGGLGLSLAERRHPDLIVLDLHLPDMQGVDVLQRLKQSKECQEIPVIVLSADATPGQIERLILAGARSYLTKPLDVKEFLQEVEKVIINT